MHRGKFEIKGEEKGHALVRHAALLSSSRTGKLVFFSCYRPEKEREKEEIEKEKEKRGKAPF